MYRGECETCGAVTVVSYSRSEARTIVRAAECNECAQNTVYDAVGEALDLLDGMYTVKDAGFCAGLMFHINAEDLA